MSFTFGLQAQVSSTSTGTSVSDDGFGTSIINIAAPNSSGFSNNTYSNFNISNNGIILNNSGSTSASQLTGRDVNGNTNITAGNEASLILNQVTSNNSSLGRNNCLAKNGYWNIRSGYIDYRGSKTIIGHRSASRC